jgi:hypothetical protein
LKVDWDAIKAFCQGVQANLESMDAEQWRHLLSLLAFEATVSGPNEVVEASVSVKHIAIAILTTARTCG